MVQVVGLDVGDHYDVGVEQQERRVRLVGLGHVEVAGAVAAVGVEVLHDAADEKRRVEAHVGQHRGRHGRRRGLAVGAGDGHGTAAAGQRREHLGAGPHGDAELLGAHHLGVGLGHGR